MADEDQVTLHSGEPSKSHIYRDTDSDFWYWANGWRLTIREENARRESRPDSLFDRQERSWTLVTLNFPSCFPWTRLPSQTIAPNDMAAHVAHVAELPVGGRGRGTDFIIADAPQPGEQGFVVKDSGQREEYPNGFVRDTEDNKPDLSEALTTLYQKPELAALITRPGFDLLPVEALERWSDHMFKGAQKYGRDNWRQARGLVAVARFCRSLVRHVAQYIAGDRSEDHAAATTFNVWAAELTPKDDL